MTTHTSSFGYETNYGDPPALADGLEVRLFSMEYCPFAERARVALTYKGARYDVINCDLTNKPQCLFKANPNGQVPALWHKGEYIYESEAVVEYADAAFDGPAIFPKDPLQRAKARMLSLNQSSKLIPLFYKVTLAKRRGINEADAIKELHEALQKWVEEPLTTSGGPFFFGKEITSSDLLIWPWLHRLESLSKGKRAQYEINADKFPKLAVWFEKLHKVPAFQDNLCDGGNLQTFFDAVDENAKLPYNLGAKDQIYGSQPEN